MFPTEENLKYVDNFQPGQETQTSFLV